MTFLQYFAEIEKEKQGMQSLAWDSFHVCLPTCQSPSQESKSWKFILKKHNNFFRDSSKIIHKYLVFTKSHMSQGIFHLPSFCLSFLSLATLSRGPEAIATCFWSTRRLISRRFKPWRKIICNSTLKATPNLQRASIFINDTSPKKTLFLTPKSPPSLQNGKFLSGFVTNMVLEPL